MSEPLSRGRRLALVSVTASAALAFGNVAAGYWSNSTSVIATGLEFAGDSLASIIVYLGMLVAARPPDDNHPYGHGRFEMLAGLLVGIALTLGGAAISYRSLQMLDDL
ncbi:MAG TPA: cation diffusion facilitator family transporter, partial [Bryobacteraceae bacterium]|nr:cation diffusion facilitator family transporter [Bryobacteraceae bacterium]